MRRTSIAVLAIFGSILAWPAEGRPAQAEEPAPKPSNTLRWTTASEVDNFGFDVYRGGAEEGPFVRLTSEPIPGAGTVDEPQSYSFVDDTIDPSEAYWYFVESISMSGVRERFTPVFRAAPKITPAEPEDGAEEPAVEPAEPADSEAAGAEGEADAPPPSAH